MSRKTKQQKAKEEKKGFGIVNLNEEMSLRKDNKLKLDYLNDNENR